MTSQEKDKFIVEWFGECWHEGAYKCRKCGWDNGFESVMRYNHNLTTPEGFFWLWGKMRRHPIWSEFAYRIAVKMGYAESWDIHRDIYFGWIPSELIDNRTAFRDTVCEFLKQEGR